MNKIRHFLWHNEETGEPVSESHDNLDWSADPYCPKCGQRTEYWRGTIGQDYMGNEIEAENWVCYHCHIGTAVQEID